jgi:LuxR family maltose regulon positive regulatory protein
VPFRFGSACWPTDREVPVVDDCTSPARRSAILRAGRWSYLITPGLGRLPATPTGIVPGLPCGLAEWLATAPASGLSAAWLSLDPGDNHPATFWTYVIAALRRAEPSIGADALSLLEAGQPPPIEALLTALLNELGTAPSDLRRLLTALGPAEESRPATQGLIEPLSERELELLPRGRGR